MEAEEQRAHHDWWCGSHPEGKTAMCRETREVVKRQGTKHHVMHAPASVIEHGSCAGREEIINMLRKMCLSHCHPNVRNLSRAVKLQSRCSMCLEAIEDIVSALLCYTITTDDSWCASASCSVVGLYQVPCPLAASISIVSSNDSGMARHLLISPGPNLLIGRISSAKKL